eukprot:g42758.t1
MEGEYLSGPGILLEVTKMAAYNPLDVEARGVVSENQRDTIIAVGVKRRVDIGGQPILRNGNRDIEKRKGGVRDGPGEEEGDGGWGRFKPSFQEEMEGTEIILMGDGYVKALYIHGEEEAAGVCKLEILKLAWSIRNIADVSIPTDTSENVDNTNCRFEGPSDQVQPAQGLLADWLRNYTEFWSGISRGYPP